MQGKPLDVVGLELSFNSNPKTTSTENGLILSAKKPSLSKLCHIISPFIDVNNTDHNTFFACLLLLAEECLFDDYCAELHVDILLRMSKALDNILSFPSNITHKLEREWLPHLDACNVLIKRYNRRPRSLEAVPSYDSMSPMRMSLTPRETVLSPKLKVDSPRAVSSPVKEISHMKRFWQDGDKLKLKDEQDTQVFDSDDVQGHSLGQ
jgi:hypothetical protein